MQRSNQIHEDCLVNGPSQSQDSETALQSGLRWLPTGQSSAPGQRAALPSVWPQGRRACPGLGNESTADSSMAPCSPCSLGTRPVALGIRSPLDRCLTISAPCLSPPGGPVAVAGTLGHPRWRQTGAQLHAGAWPPPWFPSSPLPCAGHPDGQGSFPKARTQHPHLASFFHMAGAWLDAKRKVWSLQERGPPLVGSYTGLPTLGELAVPDRWSGPAGRSSWLWGLGPNPQQIMRCDFAFLCHCSSFRNHERSGCCGLWRVWVFLVLQRHIR